MLSRAMIALIGKPPPICLPSAMMSGVTPEWSIPQYVRSAGSGNHFVDDQQRVEFSASEAMAGSQSGGGMMLPAVPCIGSTTKAAMAPAPPAFSCRRASSTQARPHEG